MQIVEKRGGVRRIVEHVGSARGDADLAVLLQAARERMHEGQQVFDLGPDIAGQDAPNGAAPVSGSTAMVAASRCEVLWQVLTDAYAQLGFDAVGDEAFEGDGAGSDRGACLEAGHGRCP